MQFWVHRSLWLNSANPAGTRQGSEQMYLENGKTNIMQTLPQISGTGWPCSGFYWQQHKPVEQGGIADLKPLCRKRSVVNLNYCCLVSQAMSVIWCVSKIILSSLSWWKQGLDKMAQPLVLVNLIFYQCWWIHHFPGDITPMAYLSNCEKVSACVWQESPYM